MLCPKWDQIGPFNFWRTTGDPYPDWGTTMRELNTLRHVVNSNYEGECVYNNPHLVLALWVGG